MSPLLWTCGRPGSTCQRSPGRPFNVWTHIPRLPALLSILFHKGGGPGCTRCPGSPESRHPAWSLGRMQHSRPCAPRSPPGRQLCASSCGLALIRLLLPGPQEQLGQRGGPPSAAAPRSWARSRQAAASPPRSRCHPAGAGPSHAPAEPGRPVEACALRPPSGGLPSSKLHIPLPPSASWRFDLPAQEKSVRKASGGAGDDLQARRIASIAWGIWSMPSTPAWALAAIRRGLGSPTFVRAH